MTFPQHIAVTMATAALRVATGVRASDVEGRSEDQRWREREREEKQGRMPASKVGKSEERRGGGVRERERGRGEERWSPG